MSDTRNPALYTPPAEEYQATMEIAMVSGRDVTALAWALYRKVTLYGVPLLAEALRTTLAPLYALAVLWTAWMRIMVP
jgi:hypothetical protein